MRVDAPTLVREATLADAAAVGDVHAEAWRTAYRDLFEVDRLTAFVEKRRKLWATIMPTPEFARTTLLLAEHRDRVAAFAHFGPNRDNARHGEIYAIYALPSVWGSGLAATLMDSAWDLLVEAGYLRVRLWTLAGANRARRFYTGFGFRETGRTKERDYGDGRPVLEVEYARSTRDAALLRSR